MITAPPAPAPPAEGRASAGGDTPRARRQARLKAEIFRAALDLIEAKGYDAVTVEEIASAADIAKGTFFNYFPTKEHLLVEYRRSMIEYIHEYGESLEGDSARELVKRYYRKMARHVRSEGRRYDMLFKEVIARPHLLAVDPPHRERFFAYFGRYLEVGKKSGEIPESCDTRLLFEMFRDIWTGTSMHTFIDSPTASMETRMMRKIDMLFDLLAVGSTKGG